MHVHGLSVVRSQVGLGYDEEIVSGWATMGKTCVAVILGQARIKHEPHRVDQIALPGPFLADNHGHR
jgi:hypothetical protein